MVLPNSIGSTVIQGGGGGSGSTILIVWLLLIVVTLAGAWKTFEKANQPGWTAIIPIYNLYIMTKIGNNEWWWLLVAIFVPIVNLYAIFKIMHGVAKAFGKGAGFALGLWFLAFIFFPLLGFGDHQYQGPPE